MSNWETHYLPDVEHFIRLRLCTNGCLVEFEAFESIAWSVSEEWPENIPDKVYRRDWTDSISDAIDINNLDLAHRTLFGDIKWDGCSDITYGEKRDEGYAHYCGMSQAILVGKLLEHIYRIAWEFYLSKDEDGDGRDWELYYGWL